MPDLELDGTLTLNNTNNVTGRISFPGNQTISGNGAIVFAGNVNPTRTVVQPTDGGTLTIGPGITVSGGNGQLGNPGLPLVNMGFIVADTSGRTLSIAGSTVSNSGTIYAQDGNIFSDEMILSGTISVDAGQTLTLQGDLTRLPASVTTLGITGVGAGQAGKILVSGESGFDCTLNLLVEAGYMAAIDDAIGIEEYSSRSGTYQIVMGDNLGGGLVFDPSYEPNALNLIVVPSPEP